MSQNAINYLAENKDKFPKETLIDQLKESGYGDDDIVRSVDSVFGSSGQSGSDSLAASNLFDFSREKVYQNSSDKWKDFLLGFISPWLFGFIIQSVLRLISYSVMFLGGIFIIVLEVIAIISLFKRRKFISYGLIGHLLFSFVFMGAIGMIILLMSRF